MVRGTLLKELLLQVGGVWAKQVMEVREEQPANAAHPMLVTELGIVREVREEQSANASYSMLVTELGRVMEVREEHLLNASAPMLVTE